MFVLSIVEDVVKISPSQFDKNFAEALIDEIENKYANRIIPDVGLVISFYDFETIGDPYVYPSEGSVHVQVKFRLIIFRPFSGEILTGKVTSSNAEGLKVSLGFFSDIVIPNHLLQTPSVYEETTGKWIWNYDSNESNSQFSISVGDEIRFGIRGIKFTKYQVSHRGVQVCTTVETSLVSSAPPATSTVFNGMIPISAGKPTGTLVRKRSTSVDITNNPVSTAPSTNAKPVVQENSIPPMMLVGCIDGDGLGPLHWWD